MVMSADPDAERQDVVILHTGHQVRGSITESDDQHLTISTAGGLMVLDQTRVASVNYGTNAPKTVLTPGDDLQQRAYQRDLRLAQMAFATNKRDSARNLLEKHRTRLDLDGLRLLGHLRDANNKPEKALELYRKYEELGGQDGPTLKRLRTIELALEQYEKRMADYLSRNDAVSEEPQVQNGLEADESWKAEKPDFANPAQTWIINHPDLESDKLLQIDADGGKKWKAAAFRSIRFDATDNPIVNFKILNPGKRSVGLSVAVKTGNRHAYYESTLQQVPAGKEWYPIRFDLREETFKCAVDNYRQHAHPILDINDVREIQIQVHNRSHQVTVVINDLYFMSADQPDVIVVPKPVVNDTSESARNREEADPKPEIIPGITE